MHFLVGGLTIAWAAPTLPRLLAEKSHIRMTPDESSWVVSVLSIGASFSIIPLAYMTKTLGRKINLILSLIPFIVAWLIIIFASSVEALYVARFLGGVAIMFTFAVVPMYLTEIADVPIRGILSSLPQLFYNIGAILEFSIIPYVSYTIVGVISIIFPIVNLLILLFVPESPYFLMLVSKDEEAEKSLMLLRGQSDRLGVQQEFISMKKSVEESKTLREAPLKDLFVIKGNRRALILCFVLVGLQQFCGQLAIVSYTTQIFENTSSSLNADLSVIILGCIQAVVSILLSSMVDRTGRRPLILASISGVSISCLLLGVYFYLESKTDFDLSPIQWIPMTSLVLYMSSFSLALGVLPFTLIGEIFPTNVKGMAASILMFLHATSGILTTKLFQVMTDDIGPDSPFWMFLAFCLAALIFTAWYLPETKGKTFTDIYEELNEKEYPRRGKMADIMYSTRL
ncbi:Facilitated trehalose transporter Tret1 [Blattella germanica]|nr:Facilitated trehalose transporter Tret1 [Blattella germanica]